MTRFHISALRWVAMALVLTTSVHAQASDASWRARVGAIVRDTVLANGLTVIVAENHAAPVVTVEVAFRSGAVAQNPGEEGMAHLLEHLVFRAYGDEAAFAQAVADMNGTYNGTTAEEQVRYWITVPGKEGLNAIRVMARLVRDAKFRSRDLGAEKNIVVDELARGSSDVGSRLSNENGQRLWGDEWTRKNPGGTAESVGRVKLERVQAMLADQYVPSNAAVVVSGDCQAADVVAEVVRRFGDWKSAAAQPGAALAMPKATSQTQSFAVSGAEERLVTVQIQWAGPSVRESPADDHAADVFVSAVTSAAALVVPRLLASGVIHSVTFSSESQARRGSLTLTAVVTPIGIERALTELRSELDLIANPSFLTEAMVVAGKKNLTVHSEYWFEAGSSLAHTIGYWWTAAGLEYVRDYGDALARVDLAQVQSFVRRYVTGQPYVAGALTPPSYQERVARALAKTFVGNP